MTGTELATVVTAIERDGARFRPLVYLACPYTHPSKVVERRRYVEATKAAAWLIETKKWNVFSPITHSHPLHIVAGLSGLWDHWKQIDTDFIQLSHTFVVLKIEGYKESRGVTDELVIARETDCRILWLSPRGPNNYTLSEYETT